MVKIISIWSYMENVNRQKKSHSIQASSKKECNDQGGKKKERRRQRQMKKKLFRGICNSIGLQFWILMCARGRRISSSRSTLAAQYHHSLVWRTYRAAILLEDINQAHLRSRWCWKRSPSSHRMNQTSSNHSDIEYFYQQGQSSTRNQEEHSTVQYWALYHSYPLPITECWQQEINKMRRKRTTKSIIQHIGIQYTDILHMDGIF